MALAAAASLLAWQAGTWSAVAQREMRQETAAPVPGMRPDQSSEPKRSRAPARIDDLAVILKDSDEIARAAALLDWLDRLPSGGFSDALEEFEKSPLAPLRREERNLMIRAWAGIDPVTAAAWIDKKSANSNDRENLAYVWATHDPKAALAWAEGYADESNSSFEAKAGVFHGIAASDPDLGKSYVAGAREEDLFLLACGIEPELISRGFDFSIHWIGSLPNENARDTFSLELSEKLAKLDPARAAEWSSGIEYEGAREGAWKNIATVWGATQPESARDWVAKLPEGMGKDDAVIALTAIAAVLDPVGTEAWLRNLGDREELDPARTRYVTAIEDHDPRAALEFLPALRNDKDRLWFQDSIASLWVSADAPAAKAWVEAHAGELAPELVEKIRSLPDTPAAGK